MPNPRKVNVTLWLVAVMEPGDQWTYWEEYNPSGEVRWFIAEPQPITDPVFFESWFEDDKIVSVVDVFQIMKGREHIYDGTGGTGDLQVNVTFQNRSTGAEKAIVHILQAETASN